MFKPGGMPGFFLLYLECEYFAWVGACDLDGDVWAVCPMCEGVEFVPAGVEVAADVWWCEGVVCGGGGDGGGRCGGGEEGVECGAEVFVVVCVRYGEGGGGDGGGVGCVAVWVVVCVCAVGEAFEVASVVSEGDEVYVIRVVAVWQGADGLDGAVGGVAVPGVDGVVWVVCHEGKCAVCQGEEGACVGFALEGGGGDATGRGGDVVCEGGEVTRVVCGGFV